MAHIAFVPARCGSKSIKLKNIRPLCGNPLIYWCLYELQQAQSIDRVVVATDCYQIKDTVEAFNFSKVLVYERLAENANDKAGTEAVMLEYIEAAGLPDNDLFVLVQATSPFTQAQHIDQAIKKLTTGEAYDSLLSVVRLKRFYWTDDGQAINYDYRNRPRRQDFVGQLMENGAFYMQNVGGIKTHQNRLGERIALYEMPEYTGLELDEENDWLMAEQLMVKHDLTNKGGVKWSDIQLFMTDVDGTLTDAGMYYSEKGDELKRFSAYDGKGLELLCKAGIKVGIITAEDRELNRRRARKLKLDFEYHANHSKLETIQELCQQLNITLKQVAYIGDDINDLELLSHVGISACPDNARPEIKAIAHIIKLKAKGGQGAVREFADMILKHRF